MGEREGEGEVSIEAHRRKNCWRKIGGAEMHAFMGGLTLGEQQQQQKDLFSGVYSIALFFLKLFFVWSFSSVHSRSSCWPNTILLRFWQRGVLIGVELAGDDRRGGDSGG